MKYSVNEVSRLGLAVSFYTIIIIILMAIFTLTICNVVKDSKTSDIINEAFQDCIDENEILWTYVENVDTCTSLEDAIAKRDSILYQIQFLDE